MIDAAANALIRAEQQAEALFGRVVELGLIRAGVSESALSDKIHALARSEFGVRRHWHARVVRSGPNTLLGYGEPAPDRVLLDDDILFLDFGPVFDSFEADLGRTYVLGNDPDKHRLASDLTAAFAEGCAYFDAHPGITAGEMYDHAVTLATRRGWHFAASSAGHPVGRFPHEPAPGGDPDRYSIEHGNELSLRDKADDGSTRHWILELHFADPARRYAGFVESLLTLHR